MQDALALVELVAKAATAYQRPDLARRLSATHTRLSDPAVHVLVVGEFKQGKSSLINALVGAPVCPVDDDVATAVPTAVRHADVPYARVRYAGESEGVEGEVVDIAVEDVASYVTESANPDNREHLKLVEVGLPRRVLATGVVLVDTPGVGGLGSAHAATTLAALPMADALLFVSDASQEYSGPELDFLRQARELCPDVACVMTKIDFYPAWRKVAELNRGHLDRVGVRAPILPVSSTLRNDALAAGDQELNQESGFPALVTHLRDEVARQSSVGVVGAAVADMRWAVTQLRSQFEGELAALADPTRAQAVMVRLEDAKAQAERLRGQASRWQQVLVDGVGDLTSDLDHDLRDRLRQVVKEAEEALDISDPAETWDEFEPWLYRRTAQDVAHHYALMSRRGRELAAAVAEVFALDGHEVNLVLQAGSPTDTLGGSSTLSAVELKSAGVVQQALTVMRGTYGGVLMFSMMPSMLLGLALPLAPIAAIGMFLGRKTLSEERERQLGQRRSQAKAAVRKYIDDVSFAVSKESRDNLRLVHRQLRDHFTAQADELHRSAAAAQLAAQEAMAEDGATQAKRQRDVEAELQRLAGLSARVEALAGQQ